MGQGANPSQWGCGVFVGLSPGDGVCGVCVV